MSAGHTDGIQSRTDSPAETHAIDAADGEPIIRIAVASPVRRLYDYLPPSVSCGDAPVSDAAGDPPPPDALSTQPPIAAQLTAQRGVRVRVPFGRTQRVGIVVDVVSAPDVPREKLRRVSEVLDPAPVIEEPDSVTRVVGRVLSSLAWRGVDGGIAGDIASWSSADDTARLSMAIGRRRA